ncbi:DMT family transporter [Chitinimonas taiwanensis]|jgi:quaternary ammonium compound-resistance protein SugE|uniref:Guanidinium exporter n=1 Tax=Chitinimonas taiwanensis DSM 18899 TaxID=1121279 RepID=A0A1K2HL54_9NEIS|nr:multidrug efflux SMR transporter [Chitinimonas taiwanensis]SFZ77548.1 quaternary ammonium compound-resistance protein SugE [Chitinimonas taiwanensis DSM 18899]
MHWIYLLVAGLLEVVWVIGMKYSEGFSKPGWSALTLLTMTASFACLAKAMKVLPMGTAYAIWTGIGAVGGVVAGIVLFNESSDWPRLLCVLLVVGGIVGLKLTSAH